MADEVWPDPCRLLAAGPDATSAGCL